KCNPRKLPIGASVTAIGMVILM
ncbi:hypothetical protein V3C99_001095, partial [Haemonchus contortus]